MIGYVMFGTSNIKESTKFYDLVLSHLGMIKVEIDDNYVGYAISRNSEKVIFYITKPFNNEIASFGNGTMIALQASSNTIVDKCHAAALNNGAVNEGFPGLRDGYGNIYYSYFRDLDNNKICIYSDN